MRINNDLSQERAFEDFKIARGEDFGPYGTPSVLEDNLDTMFAWGSVNLSGGYNSADQRGFWDLAFAACLKANRLTRDPNWKSREQRIKDHLAETEKMPAKEYKARLLSDPDFKAVAEGRI